MSDFHWALREHLHVLRKDERLYVLMSIYLHRNIRYRAYPSNAEIMKETGLTASPVTNAIKWFVEHQAFLKVPYGKRVGDERELGKHKNIYQLTGILRLEDVVIPYLHLTPEGWRDIAVEVEAVGEYSLGEYLRSEYSRSRLSTTSIQSFKDINIRSSHSSAVAVGAQARANDVRTATPAAARTESLEQQAFHRRKTYYQAFEAAFPDDARTKVSDTRQNKNHARELFLASYTPDEVTALVRSKLALGKADYRFHYLMPDLAEARLRRSAPANSGSNAPPEHRAPDAFRQQYAEVNDGS